MQSRIYKMKKLPLIQTLPKVGFRCIQTIQPVLLSRPLFRSRDQDNLDKTKTLDFRSRDQDRDLAHQVSRPRPGSSGLETRSETLAIRSRDRERDLDKMNLNLDTMVSRSHHWLHQFQLVTQHSLKGATNYGNHATGVGTKHAVLRVETRLRPGSSGLETETWTK